MLRVYPFYGLLLLAYSFSTHVLAYNHFPPDGFGVQCVQETLNKLEASYGGQSTGGNKYNVYAIKSNKDWFFIILDTTGLHSLKYPHKSGTLINNSVLFTDG